MLWAFLSPLQLVRHSSTGRPTDTLKRSLRELRVDIEIER